MEPPPGNAAELLLLVGVAPLISAWMGGRPRVRGLFAGLTRWPIGATRWLLALAAMPVPTLGVGAASGTLRSPEGGWGRLALLYAVTLVLIAVTASLWEETAWAGFVQRRMVARKGLLVGSLLTTIPFGLIHLPLAFEGDGWAAPRGRRPSSTVGARTQASAAAAGVREEDFREIPEERQRRRRAPGASPRRFFVTLRRR